MLMSVKERDASEARPGLRQPIKGDMQLHCMCVVSVYYFHDPWTQNHTQTHTNKPLDVTPFTQSWDLIPPLSYLCIGQVPQCAIRRRKGEKHKPSEEEHEAFEVAFLLGASSGVTWLVKQIIKRNGLGGLGSFISEGKNKVLDDLGGILELDWMGIPMPAGTVYSC